MGFEPNSKVKIYLKNNMNTKVQKVAATPLATLFEMHKKQLHVCIWLSEQKDCRIEGKIAGFDEFMNLVLDEAEEISVKTRTRKSLGTIMLKGENLSMITMSMQ